MCSLCLSVALNSFTLNLILNDFLCGIFEQRYFSINYLIKHSIQILYFIVFVNFCDTEKSRATSQHVSFHLHRLNRYCDQAACHRREAFTISFASSHRGNASLSVWKRIPVNARCRRVTRRWVNIDKGRLRTRLAERRAPEGHNGPTEPTQKQFVWPQQPDGGLPVRSRFKEPGFCLLCLRCLPVRGWAPKENTSSGSPDVYICARASSPNTHT